MNGKEVEIPLQFFEQFLIFSCNEHDKYLGTNGVQLENLSHQHTKKIISIFHI